jgi:hypothetical protein
MSLRDVFRRIGERFLRSSRSRESNGAIRRPQDQAPLPPIDEAALPYSGPRKLDHPVSY